MPDKPQLAGVDVGAHQLGLGDAIFNDIQPSWIIRYQYSQAMEAIVLFFRLQLIASANKLLIANLPEITQPYGSFVAGQFFTWNGHTYRIEDVAHGAIAQQNGPLLMETSLLLS
ncbi:hypothetical protein [Methylobacterium mesophilicum]|uniref:hypothetical protein n=1 Tax=Methylobacterium mesophilicum TaxID=39956 RepID=UPI002F34F9D7